MNNVAPAHAVVQRPRLVRKLPILNGKAVLNHANAAQLFVKDSVSFPKKRQTVTRLKVKDNNDYYQI